MCRLTAGKKQPVGLDGYRGNEKATSIPSIFLANSKLSKEKPWELIFPRCNFKLYRPMQTDAISHNIVSPTMLGVVGTCCMVHANERNNCQHCWRSSTEAMHSGTVILTMRGTRRFHEANIVVVSCKRAQYCLRCALPVTKHSFIQKTIMRNGWQT